MCSQVEDQNHLQSKALILNSVTAQRNETIKEKSETSRGWLVRFKERCSPSPDIKVQGPSASGTRAAAGSQDLAEDQECRELQILNAGERVFYWKMVPCGTVHSHREVSAGFKGQSDSLIKELMQLETLS